MRLPIFIGKQLTLIAFEYETMLAKSLLHLDYPSKLVPTVELYETKELSFFRLLNHMKENTCSWWLIVLHKHEFYLKIH